VVNCLVIGHHFKQKPSFREVFAHFVLQLTYALLLFYFMDNLKLDAEKLQEFYALPVNSVA